MNSLKRWFVFTAISLSLVSIEAYPVLASETPIPLPSAVEYVFTESAANTSDAADKIVPNEGRVMHVITSEYKFVPNVLQVRKNEVVTLELKNDGKEPHNLTFKTLALKTPDIPAGATAELKLPPNLAPGRYPFVCTVPGHLERGMRGVLVVQ